MLTYRLLYAHNRYLVHKKNPQLFNTLLLIILRMPTFIV